MNENKLNKEIVREGFVFNKDNTFQTWARVNHIKIPIKAIVDKQLTFREWLVDPELGRRVQEDGSVDFSRFSEEQINLLNEKFNP